MKCPDESVGRPAENGTGGDTVSQRAEAAGLIHISVPLQRVLRDLHLERRDGHAPQPHEKAGRAA